MHGILLTVRTCVSRITSCTLTPEAVVIIFTRAAMFTWVTLTLIHYNTVEIIIAVVVLVVVASDVYFFTLIFHEKWTVFG